MSQTQISRRTQEERRTEAESKLLAAAMDLIAEQGIEKTSLAQIGQRAGFSRGIVNHHFGTKLNMVERLIEESQRAFVRALPNAEGRNGLDQITMFADEYLKIVGLRGHHGQAFLVMWAEAAGAGRELRPTFATCDQNFRNAVSHMVEKGIADGSIQAETNARAVAVSMLAELRGIGLELMVAPEAFGLGRIRKDIVNRIRRSLAA